MKNFFSFNLWAKIFLLWLVLHFFLQNLITYAIWIDLGIFWLWKEIIIVFFFFLLLFLLFKTKEIKKIHKDKLIFTLELVFVFLVFLTFLVNFFFIWTSLKEYIMAFRYDLLAYLIFFIIYHLLFFVKQEYIDKLVKFYWYLIKWLLIFALLWYFVLMIMPGWLSLFWYNDIIYDWEFLQAPPAAYYTQYNQWIVRNQALFERPISYWFFLVAFFPLFYMLFLRKRSFSRTWFWWWVYLLNIISTFSRAAWWAWFFEVLLLTLIDYRKNLKRFLKYILLPLVLVFSFIIYFWYNHVIDRQRSNTWHIQEFVKWWNMFTEAPLFGKWAAYVGPASHWWDWIAFNPENQFLQILIEFWIVWFLLWFFLYLFFVFVGFYYFYNTKEKDRKNNPYLYWLLAFSVGLIWLSIQWMVLHSFVDNMIVYPFMFLFALVFYLYHKKLK